MNLSSASGRATAAIDPDRGGRLSSLTIDGTEILARAEPMGSGPTDWFDGSFPMAPYPGNVRDGMFHFEGQTYELPPNNGSHAAHGLVDVTRWDVIESTETRAELRVALSEPWPFGGFVAQNFSITENNLDITMVCGNEQRSMPAALGFHPWFRRDLGDGPARLQFTPRSRFQPLDPGLFGVAGSDLGERPWDNAFSEVHGVPGLTWPGGQRISVVSDAPVWMLYEQHPDGICIEPLTAAPDALAPGRPAVVGPGRPLTLTMRLDWS